MNGSILLNSKYYNTRKLHRGVTSLKMERKQCSREERVLCVLPELSHKAYFRVILQSISLWI